MEAVLRANQIGNGALGETECGFLELGHSLTLHDPAKVAAFFLAHVFGILLGQIFEFAGFPGLLEDVFGLLADFLDFRVGLADRLEEDVLDVDAVRHLILLDVPLIDSLQFVVADLHALADLIDVREPVADDAAFGNLIA